MLVDTGQIQADQKKQYKLRVFFFIITNAHLNIWLEEVNLEPL